MKAIICVSLVTMVTVAFARPEQYTNQYDNVNLSEILPNDHLRQQYVKCMMDQGKCTPDAKELKSHVREALDDDCAKCSDVHKDGVKKVIKYLVNCQPGEWKELSAKYDPDNKYSKKYEDKLKDLTSNCEAP